MTSGRTADAMIVSGGNGPAALTEDAWVATTRAVRRAGVEIRLLESLPELRAVYDLFDRIWQPAKTNVPVTVEQLRAMTHAGNYLAGAYEDGRLVGACVGFFAAPPGVVLHSHVAGVDPRAQGRGIGFALKVHQRAWTLDQGLSTVTWTFDPLVRRNAYVNLGKLGAVAGTYLVDFYGDMEDAINDGQGSDRLLLEWDLASPVVAGACAGEPVLPDPGRTHDAPLVVWETESGEPMTRAPGTAPVALVQVPADIESVRRRDPGAGVRWRSAVRETLGGMIDEGAVATGVTRSGAYVVELTAS